MSLTLFLDGIDSSETKGFLGLGRKLSGVDFLDFLIGLSHASTLAYFGLYVEYFLL
jgi:hypothetical protein